MVKRAVTQHLPLFMTSLTVQTSKAGRASSAQVCRKDLQYCLYVFSPALACCAVGIIRPSIMERQSQSKASNGGVDGLAQDVEHL